MKFDPDSQRRYFSMSPASGHGRFRPYEFLPDLTPLVRLSRDYYT